VRKSKPLSLKKTSSPTLRISECITLDVIKRGHNTGTIKKMLHVPTLQLLCVREEPTSTRESRNSIKEWVNFWQTKLAREGEVSPFLKIHSVAYNYPEGAISILIDYFEEGSLLDLLELLLTLPESVIREVFEQVIVNLKKYYDQTEMQFGGLSPSQILITD
jgi:serine/threonine protein kinase